MKCWTKTMPTRRYEKSIALAYGNFIALANSIAKKNLPLIRWWHPITVSAQVFFGRLHKVKHLLTLRNTKHNATKICASKPSALHLQASWLLLGQTNSRKHASPTACKKITYKHAKWKNFCMTRTARWDNQGVQTMSLTDLMHYRCIYNMWQKNPETIYKTFRNKYPTR